MAYRCRFCGWRSLFTDRIEKEHTPKYHPKFTFSLEVNEVKGGVAVKREDLDKANIYISDPTTGFAHKGMKITAMPNQCRFCDFKSKKPDELVSHINQHHQTGIIELDVCQINKYQAIIWKHWKNANKYQIDVAKDAEYKDIIASEMVTVTTQMIARTVDDCLLNYNCNYIWCLLDNNARYHWRVRVLEADEKPVISEWYDSGVLQTGPMEYAVSKEELEKSHISVR